MAVLRVLRQMIKSQELNANNNGFIDLASNYTEDECAHQDRAI